MAEGVRGPYSGTVPADGRTVIRLQTYAAPVSLVRAGDNPDEEAAYLDQGFTALYYDDPSTWRSTYWLGIHTAKCPLDLWIFQEIIAETRPDLIIETGTHLGGSALFLACMCDLVDNGEVLTIDVVDDPGRPRHRRVSYLHGSSTDPAVVEEATRRAGEAERVMVVLDSDHTAAHVFAELTLLAPLVTPGCYLVVEDTIVNGNPVLPDFGPGPGEALARYVAAPPSRFVVDRTREKFHLTFNPGGYLRRIGS
jgi:cephalosporin hydroxylase